MKHLEKLASEYAQKNFPIYEGCNDRNKAIKHDVAYHSFADGFNEAMRILMDIGNIKYLDKRDEHPKSPWISVKDRLPTRGGHYLCMDENHNIAVLAFVGDKWINTKTFTDVPFEVVIYWMPKPPLPKE